MACFRTEIAARGPTRSVATETPYGSAATSLTHPTAPPTDLEPWLIAGGSAGAALYTFTQPGFRAYLNHNLIDAVLKGAAAHVNVVHVVVHVVVQVVVQVEDGWNKDLLEQVSTAKPIKQWRYPSIRGRREEKILSPSRC
jgi:hypothetical protein